MNIISRQEAVSQGLNKFYTGKPCRHGHLSERYTNDGKCAECVKSRVKTWADENNERKKASDKAAYQKNRSDRLQKEKARREANREQIIAKQREYSKSEKGRAAAKLYRDKNREKINAEKMDLYRKNRETHLEQKRRDHQKHKASRIVKAKEYRIKNKDKLNSYFVERRKSDLNFKMSAYMRNMLMRLISRGYHSKENSTVIELGYTCEDLIKHIESLFTDGMSWDNYGEWHIDHVYPISKFIKDGVTSPAIINALSNLQPLWAKDNLAKGCK